jgi:hypothetical protein
MDFKKRVGEIIEWLFRAETIYTFAKVYLLPVVAPLLTATLGYLGGQSLMWIAMASFVSFGAASLGILSFSAYRERKNPAHKLVYEGTNFNSELLPASVPFTGNRQQRRQARGQLAQTLSPNQIMPSVSRKISKGQIGVFVKNKASFPISCLLFNASTSVEDFTPPRSNFPKPTKLLGPGERVLISDDAIDMEDVPCEPFAGEMEITIRYGLPGDERHELRLRANIHIQMEHFGFVSNVQSSWLS